MGFSLTSCGTGSLIEGRADLSFGGFSFGFSLAFSFGADICFRDGRVVLGVGLGVLLVSVVFDCVGTTIGNEGA